MKTTSAIAAIAGQDENALVGQGVKFLALEHNAGQWLRAATRPTLKAGSTRLPANVRDTGQIRETFGTPPDYSPQKH